MELRFIVDSNAGKLATWLRMIGYDTVFFSQGSDRDLLDRALAERRILLTRDTRIFQRKIVASGEVTAVLLQDDDPEKQLKQVVDTLNLDVFHKPLSVCLKCNEPLVPAAPQEVKDLVPPYVFKKQTRFFRCPVCRRVYWEGSHQKAMESRLKRLLEAGNK